MGRQHPLPGRAAGDAGSTGGHCHPLLLPPHPRSRPPYEPRSSHGALDHRTGTNVWVQRSGPTSCRGRTALGSWGQPWVHAPTPAPPPAAALHHLLPRVPPMSPSPSQPLRDPAGTQAVTTAQMSPGWGSPSARPRLDWAGGHQPLDALPGDPRPHCTPQPLALPPFHHEPPFPAVGLDAAGMWGQPLPLPRSLTSPSGRTERGTVLAEERA